MQDAAQEEIMKNILTVKMNRNSGMKDAAQEENMKSILTVKMNMKDAAHNSISFCLCLLLYFHLIRGGTKPGQSPRLMIKFTNFVTIDLKIVNIVSKIKFNLQFI